VLYAPDVKFTHYECGSGNKPVPLQVNLETLCRRKLGKFTLDVDEYFKNPDYNVYQKPEGLKKLVNQKVCSVTISHKGLIFLQQLIPGIADARDTTA
jgi:hypothetical protein